MNPTLTITVDASGAVSVSGNVLDDALLAFGMLEVARQSLAEHHAKKRASPLLSGAGVMLPKMNGSG